MSKKDSANMSYFGSLKSIVDYEALDVQDLSRSVALIVAFVVLLWKGNQRLWALADVFGLGLCGLACFFFPQAYIQYQINIVPDEVHQLCIQQLGVCLIAMSIIRYCSLETRDHYCTMAGILSRFLGGTILLISMIYGQIHIKNSKDKSLFTQQHISYGILGCGLWWASQLIQLYNAFNSTGRRGSSIAVHSRRDIHLLILTFILMSFGLFNLGFPDFAFKTFVKESFTPDSIHMHITRSQGIISIMIALYCLFSLNFESETDKKSVFFGCLVINIVPDEIHKFSIQALGAVLISMSVIRYCSLDTRDHYCTMAGILSRFLGGTILLISNIYGQTQIKNSKDQPLFTQQHISYAILGCGLWWASQLIQLYHVFTSTGRRGSSIAIRSRRDIHLLIQTFLSLTFGLFYLGFPDFAYKLMMKDSFTPDSIHLHIARIQGIACLMTGLYSLCSLNFESETDKKSVLFGFLVGDALLIPIMFLYEWKFSILLDPYSVIIMFILEIINMLMGYCDHNICSAGCLTSKLKSS